MHPWKVTYTVGQPIGNFPMAVFKGIGPVRINFQMSSDQIGARTLKIATTSAFAGGRPQATVNSWKGSLCSNPPRVDSRGVTRGTWRGFVSYIFSAPISTALNITQNEEYIVNIRKFTYPREYCITTNRRFVDKPPVSSLAATIPS